MADHELTPTQRGEVGLAIREAGLRVADFDWREVETAQTMVGAGRDVPTVEVLVHRPTGYAFSFDIDMNNRNSLWAIFRPGAQGATQREHAGTWGNVMGYVIQWAAAVKREHDAPDLWASLVSAEESLQSDEPTPEIDNSAFTPEERQLVSDQLAEMRELLVASFELHGEQIRQLDNRVEYLAEATARMGKFDWRGLLTGQLVSLVVTAVIPQHALAVIGPFLTRTIGHLFGGSRPELPGGDDLLV
jgi:hypothetical protein